MDPSKWHKIVHFDLKGWPPQVEYLINVLKHIKSWGATGVLLEWEDTFPYINELSIIGSVSNSGGDALYTMAEVLGIIKSCREMGLEVIQLVQTVGHMEYVLKKDKFKNLREIEDKCSDLCISKPESKQLVYEMIRQVLGTQPHARFFHIGADEVSCYGFCDACKKKVKVFPQDNWRLYLQHLIDIVNFIKTSWPNITVLVWDDMIRKMDVEILKEYRLGDSFQPVVWNYNKKIEFSFTDDMWNIYKEIFPSVWAASAYKGASEPCAMVTDTNRYVSNQEAWRCEAEKLFPAVKFDGIILTGWSRFDHYATMCEMLPTSIDSLAKCLKSFYTYMDTFEEIYSDNPIFQSEWPGYEVATFITDLHLVYELEFKSICQCMVKSYMNQWQITNGFLNKQRIILIYAALEQLWNKLKSFEDTAYSLLIKYTGPRSTDEWVKTNIVPMLNEVAKQHNLTVKLLYPEASKIEDNSTKTGPSAE